MNNTNTAKSNFAHLFRTKWAFFLLLFMALAIDIIRPYSAEIKKEDGWQDDGLTYHFWVQAFMAKDLSFCKYLEPMQIKYYVSNIDKKRNVCLLKYPPGMGMLEFPFMAPFRINEAIAAPPTVGESIMCNLLGITALMLICFLALKIMQDFGGSIGVSQVTLVLFVLGSSLFNFATLDSCIPHIYSALCVVAILRLLTQAYLNPEQKKNGWALFSLSVAIVLLRNLEIFIPIYFAVLAFFFAKKSGKKSYAFLPLLLGALLAAALQLAYNSWATGELHFSSYSGNFHQDNFIWNDNEILNVLFSFHRGIFLYSPLLLLALLVPLMHKKTRLAGVLSAGLFLFFAFFYGFWYAWDLGGGSPGQRGFTVLVPLLMILWGITISRLSKVPKNIFLFLGITAALVNIYFTVAMWRGLLPHVGWINKEVVRNAISNFKLF